MEKSNNKRDNELSLIPKSTAYLEYMIEIIMKLPRIEKFNIGNEYKSMMYKMYENIIYLSKVEMKYRFQLIVKIDSELNVQRMLLKIMKKYGWIDRKKFDVANNKIYEMGKIIGGLEKYYGKNNKKPI